MSDGRQMFGGRVADFAGAIAFLCAACLQAASIMAPWDYQSAAFLVFHGEVALFFAIRTRALEARADARTWVICGVSLCDIGLVDLSATTPSTVDGLVTAMTFVGSLICIWSVGYLGRGFAILPAWRRLADRGPYRVVRHPIYAGYLLLDIALLCAHPAWSNLIVISCDIGLLLTRIQLEEHICSRSQRYRRYAARVRYKLCPGIY